MVCLILLTVISIINIFQPNITDISELLLNIGKNRKPLIFLSAASISYRSND